MDVVDEMQLVILYPKGKLPFIGILFKSAFIGEKTNSSFINNYHTYIYQLRLEPIKDWLLVTISQRQFQWKFSYIIQKYDEKEIKEFIEKTKHTNVVNFGHVGTKDGKMYPLKASSTQRLYVLKVDVVEYLKQLK